MEHDDRSGAISGRQDSAPGISSRRSACDRCRYHKAKCLRESASQARCDRCLRADAECVTSPIFKMRSRSGEDAVHQDRAHKRQRQEPDLQQRGTLAPGDGPEPTTFEWQNPPLLAISHASSDANANAALYASMFSGATNLSYDHFNGSPDLPGGFSATAPTSTTSQPAVPSAPSYPTGSERLQSAVGASAAGDGSRTDSSPDVQSRLTNYVHLKETPMQQLSKIEYKLLTLLDHLDKGPPSVNLGTLVLPIDVSRSSAPALNDILDCSKEYIDVLRLLAGTSLSHALGGAKPIPHTRPKSDSASTSAADSSTESPADSASSTLPSRSPAVYVQSGPTLDTPSLLRILTAYIYVLRLYLILSAHLHDFLREVSESNDPRLCPVAGLSFSNFPIQSGNLQTTILIQIVTNLLERIEALLGLPREYRINTRRGEPQGLLSDLDFIEMAKSIIRREDHGSPVLGRGGVKALRSNLTKIKQLLRDNIAP